MSNTTTLMTFIIISFCLALILILKKDALSPSFRRPLAIIALVMVSFSFFLLIYTVLNLG